MVKVENFFNDLKASVVNLLSLKINNIDIRLTDEKLSLIITCQETKNHIRAVKAWARGNPKYVLSFEQLDTYNKNLRNYLNNLGITDDEYKSIQSIFEGYKEHNTLKQTRWEKCTSDNGGDSDYSVEGFFNDLNKNTQHIIRNKTGNSNLYLSFKKLSMIIDNNNRERHIESLKDWSRSHQKYSISLEMLNLYEFNLKSYLHNFNITEEEYFIIGIIFKKYKENNPLRLTRYEKITYFHPNIKRHYFREIKDSEEGRKKSYFLGLMFSDGWLFRYDWGIEVGFGSTDEIVVDNYIKAIGFNPNYKEQRLPDRYVKKPFYYARFLNNDFAQDLVYHGLIMGGTKTYFITIPKLDSRTLYLCFLLGYYDGDGRQGRTSITSSSHDFLKGIKGYFKIPYDILPQKRILKSGKITYTYDLTLGADLYYEMIETYKDSLPRKRTLRRS